MVKRHFGIWEERVSDSYTDKPSTSLGEPSSTQTSAQTECKQNSQNRLSLCTG